jgi:hypothetical protein
MLRALRCWLALAVIILTVTSASAAEPKRVLLLHSYGPQFAPWVFYAGRFREELYKLSPDKIDLYEASLEGARFQEPDEQRPVIDYLAALFGSKKLDLIVTIGAPATIFVQKYRTEFFPSVPLLIGGPERRTIDYTKLTPNDAPVAVILDFKQWIESVLQVLPDTKHFAWIVGASPLEKFWTEEFRRVSQPFMHRVSFEWFNDLSFEDMQKRISTLPPHSAAFFVDVRVDAAGVPLDRESVLPKLRAATNAPIFGYVDNYLGQGIVGGPLMSSEALGWRMADAAIRILKGEAPADLKIPILSAGAPQYDWRELQHWNIAENRLPAGSIIRFRESGGWQEFHAQIALVSAVILLQGALISGLLFEHRRRRRAEIQARQRSAELAHVNRFSMAGELTATIAHEINQPLGAILANIEAAEILVKSPSPDLHEIGEIQLQQVIMNLIVNAMDSMSGMPSAERRVKVSTARDGNSACLSVSDVGSGIPAEKLRLVFEPFFSTKAQGMGMGLAIARRIVEAHGGQLSAENLAGRGAAFHVRLPLAELPQ